MRHRLAGAVLALALAVVPTALAGAQGFVPGDVNDDKTVDVLDASVLRRALAELGPGISQTCSLECGNGVLDAGEECELGTLAGQTCSSLGFGGGTLGCTAGSCLFDTSGCLEAACDPLDPEPVCGADHRCHPQPAGETPACAAGTGPGTQNSPCTSDANCGSTYICVASGTTACRRWCVVGPLDTCPGAPACLPFGVPLYANGVEYGVCI